MGGGAEINDLIARATSGDPDAQYALAATLSRAGRRDDAGRWLRAAADGGHPDALYTLATGRLNSADGAHEAAPLLRRAAEKGSASARRLLAVLFAMGVGVEADEARALADVVELARQGDEAARRELACLLAIGDRHDARIAAILGDGAAPDPVGAAFRIVRAAEGRAVGDLSPSVELLRRVRYPRALPNARSVDVAPAALDWTDLKSPSLLRPKIHASAERLAASPDAVVFRDAVAPEICEYLIAHAAPRLGPSLVYNPQGGGMMHDPLRTSKTASLSPIDLDLALIGLCRAIADAADAPHENGEFLSVLHYLPGQQYRPHFDTIPPGPDFDRSGQRTKTAILFLNDDYAGGETHFTAPDLKFRGARGDLLVFSSLNAMGAVDVAARHAGMPVNAGEKWIVTRWFRQKKYVF